VSRDLKSLVYFPSVLLLVHFRGQSGTVGSSFSGAGVTGTLSCGLRTSSKNKIHFSSNGVLCLYLCFVGHRELYRTYVHMRLTFNTTKQDILNHVLCYRILLNAPYNFYGVAGLIKLSYVSFSAFACPFSGTIAVGANFREQKKIFSSSLPSLFQHLIHNR